MFYKKKGTQFSQEEKNAYHATARAKDPLSRCANCNRKPVYLTADKGYCPPHLPEDLFYLRSKSPGSKNYQLVVDQLTKWMFFAGTHHIDHPETQKLLQETMKLLQVLKDPNKDE